MSNWEQRGNYLIEVAQRCLQGHKTFDLCRSHLVKASQISKGTIYNHFPSEADLIVAVACADYSRWLDQAKEDDFNYNDPLSESYSTTAGVCEIRFLINVLLSNV